MIIAVAAVVGIVIVVSYRVLRKTKEMKSNQKTLVSRIVASTEAVLSSRQLPSKRHYYVFYEFSRQVDPQLVHRKNCVDDSSAPCVWTNQ